MYRQLLPLMASSIIVSDLDSASKHAQQLTYSAQHQGRRTIAEGHVIESKTMPMYLCAMNETIVATTCYLHSTS